jgi:hypothetical protein
MAKGINFEGANVIMRAPEGMDNCEDLIAFRNGQQVVSCWKLTEEEVGEIRETGCVWVSIWGNTMPPISVSGKPLITVGGKPARSIEDGQATRDTTSTENPKGT